MKNQVEIKEPGVSLAFNHENLVLFVGRADGALVLFTHDFITQKTPTPKPLFKRISDSMLSTMK